jgi:hypothetical protein
MQGLIPALLSSVIAEQRAGISTGKVTRTAPSITPLALLISLLGLTYEVT